MKLRNLNIEIFTGTDPENLTNADGRTLSEWITYLRTAESDGTGEEEFIEPIDVVVVDGTVWVFIQYAEG